MDIAGIQCPKDNPPQNQILSILQKFTPDDCLFEATTLWSSHIKTSKGFCNGTWNVLYRFKNPIGKTYEEDTDEGEELRAMLHKSASPNCAPVNYTFHRDHSLMREGWVITWKVRCKHSLRAFGELDCKKINL